MNISNIMTRDVVVARPDDTIGSVAQLMADQDFGCLPVSDSDRLVGIITDRDIVTRAVASGRTAEQTVRDVMTAPARCCKENDSLDTVARSMGDQQLRRMPIVDEGGMLVGIVSLADIAKHGEAEATGVTLEKVVQPGGDHN